MATDTEQWLKQIHQNIDGEYDKFISLLSEASPDTEPSTKQGYITALGTQVLSRLADAKPGGDPVGRMEVILVALGMCKAIERQDEIDKLNESFEID